MNKKFLLVATLAAVPMAFSVAAYADHHEGKKDGKPHHKGKMLEKMFDKQDTNQDGVITKEEFMKHAEERFIEMDENNDNEVTKEEAKAYGEKMREKWQQKKQEMKEKNSAPAE